MNIESLIRYDKEQLWHPYSAIPADFSPYLVESAAGVWLDLKDEQNKRYRCIDGMSSWWSAIHGYNHPTLNNALTTQLEQTAHVMFGGLTHRPAITLAQKLINLTPVALDKVFFSDSGSVAVEVAIKIALQYWQRQGKSNKHKLIAPYGGYHGDTFMAMSVCDPQTGMHHLFKDVLNKQFFAKRPTMENTDDAIADLNKLLQQHHNEIAAFIIEPIVQGAGGMHFYHPDYLKQAHHLCQQYDVLFIADEIATGFGRTGHLFACMGADISPDILCVGKALSGGYMSLAATLTTKKISAVVNTLMHGPTFMANPLACALANASIELLLASNWQQNIAMIEQQLNTELQILSDVPSVKAVRVLGAIGVVEMNDTIDVARIQQHLINNNVWLRPFNRLLYTMPPFIAEKTAINTIARAMVSAVNA